MKAAAGQSPTDDAGMAEVRGFGFNPGALRMLAYVPADLPAGAPLVVVLHGCTQCAGAYARDTGWLALANRLGFAVLAPEQTKANNANRCFNWFEPDDVAPGSGEAASIHAMVQHMAAAHGLDAARVFVTGLSAGGAMTAAMLAAYPETFAAGAVIAGLPYGVAGNVREAFAAMQGASAQNGEMLGDLVRRAAPAASRKPRLAIWHGQADGTVNVANASALARQWAAYMGLEGQAAEVTTRPGWTRSVWRDPSGEAVLEMSLLAAVGHGAPVSAAGADGLGQAALFILETGVSSSLEIARFWGLSPVDAAATWSPAAQGAGPAPARIGMDLGETVMAAVGPHVTEEVRSVIAKALVAAGLRATRG